MYSERELRVLGRKLEIGKEESTKTFISTWQLHVVCGWGWGRGYVVAMSIKMPIIIKDVDKCIMRLL